MLSLDGTGGVFSLARIKVARRNSTRPFDPDHTLQNYDEARPKCAFHVSLAAACLLAYQVVNVGGRSLKAWSHGGATGARAKPRSPDV